MITRRLETIEAEVKVSVPQFVEYGWFDDHSLRAVG